MLAAPPAAKIQTGSRPADLRQGPTWTQSQSPPPRSFGAQGRPGGVIEKGGIACIEQDARARVAVMGPTWTRLQSPPPISWTEMWAE